MKALNTAATLTAIAIAPVFAASAQANDNDVQSAHYDQTAKVSTAEAMLNNIPGPGIAVTVYPAPGNKTNFEKLILGSTSLDEAGGTVKVIMASESDQKDATFDLSLKVINSPEDAEDLTYRITTHENVSGTSLQKFFSRFDDFMIKNETLYRRDAAIKKAEKNIEEFNEAIKKSKDLLALTR